MRHVSPVVTYAAGAVGIVVLVTLLAVLLNADRIYGVNEKISTTVWAKGSGQSLAIAHARRDAALRRAIQFINGRGFVAADVTVRKPLEDLVDAQHHYYEADQVVEVRGTYPRLARLANAISRDLDPDGQSISATFPWPPFTVFGIWVVVLFIIVLSFSVAALETREADVTQAPRGMHPFFVGIQVALIGLLLLLGILDAHLLLPAAQLLFTLGSLFGVAMLALWLYKTVAWWRQSPFLGVAWLCMTATIPLIIVVGVAALRTPLT